jgi:transcriptional regulator with XRE-family HTH domain
MAEKPRLGNKVRKLRLRHGLTQVDLADQLGISASYLNLIEHNQRPVTVPLLLKLGQLFEINLQDFAEGDRAHLLADLTEVFGDALFEGHEVKPADLQELVATSTVISRAVVALYRGYRRAQEDANALAENGCVGKRIWIPETCTDSSPDTSPSRSGSRFTSSPRTPARARFGATTRRPGVS